MPKFKLKIDGKSCLASPGQTVLQVAQAHDIEIPALCNHTDLCPSASCRLCLVEIKDRKGLFTSCSLKAEPKMEVKTNSKAIARARKTNLELIFTQHSEQCPECIWRLNCELLKLARKLNVRIDRFVDRKKNYPTYKFGPALNFDSSKCIDCRNCVEVCHKQGADFLEIKESGHEFKIVPSCDKDKDCIYCGQCMMHCPVGAFEDVRDFEKFEKIMHQKDKHIVFQFAPSIRSSIGEEFGMPPGTVVTEKLVAGIKALGAHKVFDTSTGADFTTYEEAEELVEKVMSNKGVCLSSCCPSWVKFLEFNYPEFIPHIATTRSPQMILGGIIKSFWADKEKIDPKKIVVISVMPCTAKKYEIARKENRMGDITPVDFVLTTRELAFLFKKYGIDLKAISPQKADNPLGFTSGAGVIYGASGGVAESVLRTAFNLYGKQKIKKLEFKAVRGQEFIKKAEIPFGKRIVKMAVVHGIGNAVTLLEELKRDPKAYDGIEVMACYGGCIGGGGQPVPSTSEIRQKRAQALYGIDKKKTVRMAHENPIIQKVYKDYLTNMKIRHHVCHTSYARRKKEVKF